MNFANPFQKNYLFPNISKNHQRIYKTAPNVEIWDEHGDF